MKLTNAALAELFRGLESLYHAGLPLADGVYLLAQEAAGPEKALLEALGKAMDAGSPLHAAMEDTGAFPEAALGMVRIGQETGRLEDTLRYLSEYYDQQVKTARQVKNALLYPSMILLLMLIVIGVLLMEVLPVFDRVYGSLGSALTGLAGGLLVLGQGLKAALPVLLGILAAGLVVFLLYKFVKPFREWINACLLKWFGDVSLARKFHNAQFARAMAMGLASGMGIDEALASASGLLSHIPAAKARCEACQDLIARQVPLAQAFCEAKLLDSANSRMLSLALQSGSGDRCLGDIASRLHRQAQEDLEDAVSRIEPAMVLLCSVLVGVILLAVMLPLIDIMAMIG